MPFPQMMNRFAPQMPPQMPPQFQQPPPQFNPMNMPPRFPQFIPQNQMNQMTQMNIPQPPPQIRIPFQIQQQQQQQQMPMMSPPRPEVPQFRLISPAPQQQQQPQQLNFDRIQEMINHQEQEPQVRIQLRRIQIPGPIGDIFPFLNKIQNEVEEKNSNEDDSPRQIQVQQMPLAIALSKVGITPDDLRNIQRMAEEKFQEHLRELVAEEGNDSSDSDSESTQSDEENDNVSDKTEAPEVESEEMKKDDAELHEVQTPQEEQSEEQQPQILALDRSNFGRSLNPVQLPGRMPENAEIQEAERADCKFL